jgi:hypothetical protein
LRLAQHAPAHPFSDPAAFKARIVKLRATARSTVIALTSTFAAHQTSNFQLSKVHALLELASWCETFVSLAWGAMDLPESFHRQLKGMIQGRTNGRNFEAQALNTWVCKVALFSFIPRVRLPTAPPPPLLPSCIPSPRVATWPWSRLKDGSPPPFSRVEFDAAVIVGPVHPAPLPFDSLVWYKKAHLTRSNGPNLIADVSLNTDNFVVSLCELGSGAAAGRAPVYPFIQEGLGGSNPNDFERRCSIFHPVGFFCTALAASGAAGRRDVPVFVVARRYEDFVEGSPQAEEYPYVLSSRRVLGRQLHVFPLTFVYGACVVSYFSLSSSAPKSMGDISFSVWENTAM